MIKKRPASTLEVKSSGKCFIQVSTCKLCVEVDKVVIAAELSSVRISQLVCFWKHVGHGEQLWLS